MILKIAVPLPLPELFDFLPAKDTPAEAYQPGCRVCVPFGGRKLIGVIHSLAESSELATHKLKPVLGLLDQKPLLNLEIQSLANWACQYYHHPLGEVYQHILPKMLRSIQIKQTQTQTITYYSIPATTKSEQITQAQGLARATRQQQAYQVLCQLTTAQKKISKEDLLAQLRAQNNSVDWRRIIQQLCNKNLVTAYQQTRPTTADNSLAENYLAQAHLPLNPEQRQTLNALRQLTNTFAPVLLYGITGSGKTEVYLQFIDQVLKQGKQVLVLVPEINLTPQLIARFQRRFNTVMVLLHSAVSQRQRLQNWLDAQQGRARIVIGTRSAVFTPMPHLGAIIVDEEHDPSFKQQEGFRYHARDVAIMRANKLQIPVLCGSATPSMESFANAFAGRYHFYQLTQRAQNSHKTPITVLDVRNRQIDHGISHELKDLISTHLQQQNQVLIFQNRRGFAPVLYCHHCGWIARCSQCDANLTLHLQENRMICHHCEQQQSVPQVCLACNSTQIAPLGAGTQRIESTLRKIFPDTEIFRIDRDATRRKGSFEQLLQYIQNGQSQILVGTQMIAKGHHFPNVTLVVILDIDQGLFSIDFRAPERMAQLIIQVAGRAGRADKPGQVIIQTQQPEHPFFTTLLANTYPDFARELLTQRKQNQLPPYGFQALLRASAGNSENVQKFLDYGVRVYQQLPESLRQVDVQGPFCAPMPRKLGEYHYQLLFQAGSRHLLQNFLRHWLAVFSRQNPLRHKVKWSVDIDPQFIS